MTLKKGRKESFASIYRGLSQKKEIRENAVDAGNGGGNAFNVMEDRSISMSPRFWGNSHGRKRPSFCFFLVDWERRGKYFPRSRGEGGKKDLKMYAEREEGKTNQLPAEEPLKITNCEHGAPGKGRDVIP